MRVFYRFDSYTEVTREADPDEQFSGESTSTSWMPPRALFLQKPRDGQHYDQDDVPNEKLKIGDKVYMVWMVYSTGDSFSNQDGHSCEVMGFYCDPNVAEACREAVEKSAELRHKPYDERWFEVPTYDGSSMRRVSATGWTSFFEHLDYVSVDALEVKKK